MAELTPAERLQPSLLDRLTDDHPDQQQESREERVLSPEELRECVTRDLQWLLNTGPLTQLQDLSRYPHAAKSVLTYGVRDLSGRPLSNLDLVALERELVEAIRLFEPRILPWTLSVEAVVERDSMNSGAVVFRIGGDLWSNPLPQRLYLQTEIDLETGQASVEELDPRDQES